MDNNKEPPSIEETKAALQNSFERAKELVCEAKLAMRQHGEMDPQFDGLQSTS